jgi:flagellar L-ring protein precursor FlgH
MNRLLIILLCLLPLLAAASPAPSMYSDPIARCSGDILTVQIVENTSATAVANTNTKSEYDASLNAGGTGALDFLPLLSGGGSTKGEHKGDGRTQRQGRLTGTVTVKVVEVFPDGNMRIEGQKSVVINGERQLTLLSGVIRPQDVTPENTIRSDRIADAEITFKGKGVLANTERPGVIARIFDWIF